MNITQSIYDDPAYNGLFKVLSGIIKQKDQRLASSAIETALSQAYLNGQKSISDMLSEMADEFSNQGGIGECKKIAHRLIQCQEIIHSMREQLFAQMRTNGVEL